MKGIIEKIDTDNEDDKINKSLVENQDVSSDGNTNQSSTANAGTTEKPTTAKSHELVDHNGAIIQKIIECNVNNNDIKETSKENKNSNGESFKRKLDDTDDEAAKISAFSINDDRNKKTVENKFVEEKKTNSTENLSNGENKNSDHDTNDTNMLTDKNIDPKKCNPTNGKDITVNTSDIPVQKTKSLISIEVIYDQIKTSANGNPPIYSNNLIQQKRPEVLNSMSDSEDCKENGEQPTSGDKAAEDNQLNTFVKELVKLNDNQPINSYITNILCSSGFDDLSNFCNVFDIDIIQNFVKKNMWERTMEEKKYRNLFHKSFDKFEFLPVDKGLLNNLHKKAKEKFKIKKKIAEESEMDDLNDGTLADDDHAPHGSSSIVKVLKSGVYIDKTEHIYQLITHFERVLVIRPRRFGKTIGIDTFDLIFHGKLEIFKKYACYISTVNWTKKYPVLRFDFSQLEKTCIKRFEEGLKEQIKQAAISNKVKIESDDGCSPITLFVRLMFELRNKNPVVLIDEYDAPINGLDEDKPVLESIRNSVQDFFTTLKVKKCRFVFVTGVCKIAMAGIGSGANDIKDLSLSPITASLFGFTESEITTKFRTDIQNMCSKTNRTFEDIIKVMKDYYNGYRFSISDEHVLNPEAIIECIKSGEVGDYWCNTTATTIVTKLIKNYPDDFLQFLEDPCLQITQNELMYNSPSEKMKCTRILYQTGYLTIKEFTTNDTTNNTTNDTNDTTNATTRTFKLGYPNREIRNYVECGLKSFTLELQEVKPFVVHTKKIIESLLDGKVEIFLTYLAEAFLGRSYSQKLDKVDTAEKVIHNQCYMFLKCLSWSSRGVHVLNENPNSEGKADIKLLIRKIVYIIELKYFKTEPSSKVLKKKISEAMDQMKIKKYAESHQATADDVYFLAIVFSENARISKTFLEKWDRIKYEAKIENGRNKKRLTWSDRLSCSW